MAEGIDLGFVGVFADKGSAGVGDSLGHTDNYVWIFLKSGFQICGKLLQGKIGFRQIDEKGIVVLMLSGQDACGGEPSGVAAHQLYDSDGFLLVDRRVQRDFTDHGSCILGGASKTGRVIRHN